MWQFDERVERVEMLDTLWSLTRNEDGMEAGHKGRKPSMEMEMEMEMETTFTYGTEYSLMVQKIRYMYFGPSTIT